MSYHIQSHGKGRNQTSTRCEQSELKISHFVDFDIFQRKNGLYIPFRPKNVLVYHPQGRAELYLSECIVLETF